MTSNYVTIDASGWTQAKSRPAWKPSDAARKSWRRGLPWTPAEDRELLRRIAGADSIGYNDPTMRAAAVAHGRSYCAIATRVCALKAGIRLAMAAKQAAATPTKRNSK